MPYSGTWCVPSVTSSSVNLGSPYGGPSGVTSCMPDRGTMPHTVGVGAPPVRAHGGTSSNGGRSPHRPASRHPRWPVTRPDGVNPRTNPAQARDPSPNPRRVFSPAQSLLLPRLAPTNVHYHDED